MKRASPSDVDSLRCKRRAPLSPPQSRPASPLVSRRERIAAAQTVVARELNAIFELEYKDDVLAYMNEMQESSLASSEMMELQPELEWYMRPFLLDFLIEVHAGFRLQPTTLHLAINIIDRYTSRRVVFKRHYQLLGCTALWIAAKYEEAKDKVPTLSELQAMCCDSYREQMFLQMEGHVLKTLEWTIGTATIDGYLQISLTSPAVDDTAKTVHLARMLSELALFHREFVGVRPSGIASGCLRLARQILGQEHVLGTCPHAGQVARVLQRKLDDVSAVLSKKYSQPAYESVSQTLRAFLSAPPSGHAGSMCRAGRACGSATTAGQQTGPKCASSRASANGPAGRLGGLPARLDVVAATTHVTPARPSHAFTHGMITPPAEDDDAPRYHSSAAPSHFGSDNDNDACSTIIPSSDFSPAASACSASSILDAYSARGYESRLAIGI